MQKEKTDHRYERLCGKLIKNAGAIHKKNKRRVRIGFFLAALTPFFAEGIRAFTNSSREVFLIAFVIGMFAICSYLIGVDFYDSRLRRELEEMSEREVGLDPLLGKKGSEVQSGKGTEEDENEAGCVVRLSDIMRNDFKRLSTNVVALVVLIGLCVVPCLYAWFNILSNHDPYEADATGRLSVAIVNLDAGTKIEGEEVCIGDKIVDALKANDMLGWRFEEDKDAAVSGVKSGRYYAALVIPKGFSRKLTSFMRDELKRPRIRYFENDKKNAIAPKITGKAKDALQKEINKVFASTLGETAVKAAWHIKDADVSPQETFTDIADGFYDLGESVGTGMSAVDSAITLTDSAGAFLLASDKLTEYTANTLSLGSSVLSETKADLPQKGHFHIQVDNVVDRAEELSEKIYELNDDISDLRDEKEKIKEKLEAFVSNRKEAFSNRKAAVLERAAAIRDDVKKLKQNIKSIKEKVQKARENRRSYHIFLRKRKHLLIRLAEHNRQIIESIRKKLLERGLTRAEERYARLSQKADLIKQKIESLKKADEAAWDDVSDELDYLGDELDASALEIDEAAADIDDEINETIDTGLDLVKNAISNMEATVASSNGNLGNIRRAISDEKQTLSALSGALSDTNDTLASVRDESIALAERFYCFSGQNVFDDMDHLAGLDGGRVAEKLAAPISMKTETIFPFDHYGSAMAPFYTVLAQWVGALFAAVLIKAKIKRGRKYPGLLGLFFARYTLFMAVGLVQALVVSVGDLLFLRIQCHHPFLFILAALVNGCVFTMINYALVFAFGKSGLAIGVVVLVLQVPGSGGTFPVEVLPEAFQLLYPYMPFHYALDAMRECVGGMYGDIFKDSLKTLLVIFFVAAASGIALHLPFKKLNVLMEKSMEKSDVLL